MLPFVVAGLTTGSVFALAGLGLVLTYKTSGVLNFAHGALATVSAFLFYSLHVNDGLPWPVAAGICVLVVGPALGLLLELFARRLAGAQLASRVVATVGLLLLVQAGAELVYEPGIDRQVPQFLPSGTFHIGTTPVEWFRVVIFIFGLAVTVGLFVFLRTARVGVAMRAVVDNGELLDIAGTDPVSVRRFAWVIGVMLASASGVLLAPLLPLDATTLTLLVVTAFGAAAIGRFTSLPLTYLGGLAVGVGQALCEKYFITATDLRAGLADSLPFLVLFVALLVTPRRRLAETSVPAGRTGGRWSAPGLLRVVGSTGLLVLLLSVPQFAGIHLTDWTRFVAFAIVFVALGLLTRTTGQISLAHVGFMAIGVAAFSHLAVDHGWSWGAAFVVASLLAVPVGAVLAIPAMRLSGLFLALATLGFGILLARMFYSQSYMFGNLGVGLVVPRPHIAGLSLDIDKGYYYFVLGIAVLATLLVLALNRGRLGRLLRALGDEPTGLSTAGASVNVSRVLVFCISALLAAAGGILEAAAIGNVGADTYQPMLSIQLFALSVIAVGREPWYAALAAAAQVLVPSYVTGADVTLWLTGAFGVLAVAYGIVPDARRRLPQRFTDVLDRVTPRPSPRRRRAALIPATTAAHAPVPQGGLEVANLRVRFGGVAAVDGVGFAAPTGRITGLIGPNGAGKTTTFNACSGLIRPDRGTIVLDGHSVARLGPASRARRGLGRTFQQMRLFDSLTVTQNVALGREAGYAGWNVLAHLFAPPAQRGAVSAATAEAIALCGLAELADTVVGSLSTGQRRLVELARCLAGPYHLLLLDEPSSGLDRIETERFGDILLRVVAARGVGIVLVEHDMDLVSRVCDHIYVLDFGKSIFAGTPAEVTSSPLVRAAYLGDQAVEVAIVDEDQVPA